MTGQIAGRDLGSFALIAAQLALLLFVADTYLIEESYGFGRLAPIVFAGFLVNAWIPPRFRSAWLLALFLVSVLVSLGPVPGVLLVVVGLLVFSICHLPVPFRVRVLTMLAVGILLAAVRSGALEIPLPIRRAQMYFQTQTIPLLASMFMFRAAIYLYDLRHERTPAPLMQRLSYFFMLPTVCFPLFPVIDYQTYRRSYYQRAPFEVYQKGVDWIFRGLTHLLLYRLVYHYLVPDPAKVSDLAGVLQYMVSSFLLYLRISGLFHLVVGILCLFGYDLPETHHRYYLARGFNDFWRRINIYWKDFILKLFYLPLFMALRRRGTNFAMVVATLLSFACTWLLHAYQWFWLRGSFPLPPQDTIFWGTLALLVTVNSLWEAARGRTRSLSPARKVTFGRAAVVSLQTVAMFTVMCVLWSFWTCTTIDEWVSVLSVATRAPAAEFVKLFALLAGVVVVGIAAQMLSGRVSFAPGAGWRTGVRRAAMVGGSAVALLAAAAPTVKPHLGADVANLLGTLQGDQLNARDRDRMVKGYYEDLLGTEGWGSMLWSVRLEEPETWRWSGRPTSEFIRETGDFRGGEYIPGLDVTHKGASFRTNRWGLRGEDVEPAKPSGTCRIVLLGSSYADGAGVELESTFAWLLQERLDREPLSGRCASTEIVNLAFPGDSIVRQVVALIRTGLRFEPDAVLAVATTNEALHAVRNVRDSVVGRAPDIDPEVQEIVRRAGVTPEMSVEEMERRLNAFTDEILSWGYRKLASTAAEQGIDAMWCLLPLTDDEDHRFEESYRHLSRLAEQQGLTAVSLGGVYGDLNERDQVRLAPWDWHPNSEGHSRIAERLHREMASRGFLD
ncbi:MAG: GDSL-type esterase/lipase family protein [Candidatus Eiseniibacteriota bacterium]